MNTFDIILIIFYSAAFAFEMIAIFIICRSFKNEKKAIAMIVKSQFRKGWADELVKIATQQVESEGDKDAEAH